MYFVVREEDTSMSFQCDKISFLRVLSGTRVEIVSLCVLQVKSVSGIQGEDDRDETGQGRKVGGKSRAIRIWLRVRPAVHTLLDDSGFSRCTLANILSSSFWSFLSSAPW